jgi:TRAP-type C4-dicarboxylate transport system permease large subunit
MASMSGSALADTAALATILLPMMRAHGYPMATSGGLIGAGGIIAPIIPPSMPFIIYGVTTNTSPAILFVAGIVPGLLMGLGLVIAWKLQLRKMDLPASAPMPMRERLKVTVKAFWALLMPVIYALFVAFFIHREMKVADIYGVLLRAAKTTAIVMFLCGGAAAASYMVVLADLPATLASFLGPLLDNPKVLMAVMMLIMIMIGMVLDLTPTILIVAPVLAPVAAKAGIDPYYFGLMFILVGSIGLITPPVGTVLNVVAGVGKMRFEEVVVGVMPYLITYLLLLSLFIVFPQIVTAPIAWLR